MKDEEVAYARAINMVEVIVAKMYRYMSQSMDWSVYVRANRSERRSQPIVRKLLGRSLPPRRVKETKADVHGQPAPLTDVSKR